MSIPPHNLEVGQCYLTRDAYVRRVLRIKPNLQVLYEYRGGPISNKAGWRKGMQSLEAFARAAERVVPCDWMLMPDERGKDEPSS